MGLLLRIGQIALQVGKVFSGLSPLIQAYVPNSGGAIQTINNDFAQVADIITKVEIMGQTLAIPGADKLKAATPMVAQIILQSSVLVNHKIGNPVLFQQGCSKVTDGWADILNSLKDDNIQVTDKA